jgi:hypothetical protein
MHALGSDLIYLNILGLSIVVLDKYETAIDLFEKRSGIYSGRSGYELYFWVLALPSNRPDVPMIRLIGWKMMLAILPYGTLATMQSSFIGPDLISIFRRHVVGAIV